MNAHTSLSSLDTLPPLCLWHPAERHVAALICLHKSLSLWTARTDKRGPIELIQQCESSRNINCLYVCVYLIELGPSLIELLVVDGVLQRSPHLVPFLVLRQLLLFILQRVQSLLDVFQQLVDLLPLSLCKGTKPNLKTFQNTFTVSSCGSLLICGPFQFGWGKKRRKKKKKKKSTSFKLGYESKIKSNQVIIWFECKNNWMHVIQTWSVLYQEEAHHPLITCIMITDSVYTWTFHASCVLIAS